MPVKSHKDVEFTALNSRGKPYSFKTFDQALLFAAQRSLEDGVWTNINVYIHSEAGARWWGGKSAVDKFREQGEVPMYQQFGSKLEDRGVF